MYKKIPGNGDFKISLNGKIVNNDNTECTLEIVNGKVNIKMWGVIRQLDIAWLCLIAHFEIDQLHEKFRSRIFDISFTDNDSKHLSTLSCKNMLIKPSISFKALTSKMILDSFKIVPGFLRYGINKNGDVYDTQTSKLVFKSNEHKWDCYLSIKIYNPDINKVQNIMIHRMVALAWIPNKDHIGKSIVNHIDGNKNNCNYTNLEWCNYKHNLLHAYRTNLRSDNIKCKVRNAFTKEVLEFPSVREACKYMKIDITTKLFNMKKKTKHRLVNRKFEVKNIDDNTPWFYENHEIGVKSGRFNIIVTYPDGRAESHPDQRTFKKTFGIWNVSNIEDHINRFKILYPNHRIKIIDNYNVGPIQAYNVNTNTIIESDSVIQMVKKINVKRCYITNAIKNGETRVCKGYAFRYKTDTPWDINFTMYKSSAKCISATHQETKEMLMFRSLRDAANHYSVDRSKIKLHLRNKTPYHFWVFKEIENSNIL